MKVAITGSSKLALAIKIKLQALNNAKVRCIRVEDIIMNDTNCWIFDKNNSNHVDVLINNAHQNFEQTNIFICSCAACVVASIVFSKGAPYRKHLFTNGMLKNN